MFYQLIDWYDCYHKVVTNFHHLENAKAYAKEKFGINSWKDVSHEGIFELEEGNSSHNDSGTFYINKAVFEDVE